MLRISYVKALLSRIQLCIYKAKMKHKGKERKKATVFLSGLCCCGALSLLLLFKCFATGSSLVAQWVKDLVLSLQWLRSILQYRFNPQPRGSCMPWVQQKKKSSAINIYYQHNQKKSFLKSTFNILLAPGNNL